MKHNPLHYEFKMRYVHYELPSNVTGKLQQLYFVMSEKDLQRKYNEATEWLNITMSELDTIYASSS